jgi:hypothetical protein
MKKAIIRILIFIVVLVFGAGISFLLTMAGNRTRGPVDDFMTTFSTRFSSFEKNFTDSRESRSSSLKWFDHYRNSPVVFNTTDTIFMGAYDDNTAESYESVVSLEDSLNSKLPIISFYSAWGSRRDQIFPLLRAQAIYDLGSMPMITWEPWLNDFDPEQFQLAGNAENRNKEGMKAIAEGRFDAYIDKWALDAKNFGAPFFLRLGHEMNDPYRYPWGPQNNKPEDFIAAWRHVVDRFRKTGAKNAIWLWAPHPAYTNYAEFYPGHDYVDWIGTTVINYGTVATWSQWWTFNDIFNKFYAELSLYKKPMIITEFGSLNVGGDRSQWFKQALDSLPQKFPAVKAVIYFHTASDNTTTYKTLDWSFKNDEKVLATIRESYKTWRMTKPKQDRK